MLFNTEHTSHRPLHSLRHLQTPPTERNINPIISTPCSLIVSGHMLKPWDTSDHQYEDWLKKMAERSLPGQDGLGGNEVCSEAAGEVSGVKMAAGCFLHLFSRCALPSLIQREQLMALVALSCQWEQGEALRMLRGVLFMGKRLTSGPSSLPSRLTPSGKERFGASAETGRQPGRVLEFER